MNALLPLGLPVQRAAATAGTMETAFTAIRVEGGLFPAEFLQRVAKPDPAQQLDAGYGVRPGRTLRDEIGRYWTIAEALWREYKRDRDRSDLPAERVAIERWLTRLLRDVLGYSDLTKVAAAQVGERGFPIRHRAHDGAVPLVLTTHAHDLDRSHSIFGDEGRRRAPHAAMQEYLNAEATALWGVVANGNRLRLLRDNPSLTRPAYVEADLERIFEEGLYPDFAALWLIAHATRVAPGNGGMAGCWLERWRAEGAKTGQRALERLRAGVTTALRELGSGFVEHPQNEALRAALRDGTVTAEILHQQLLRLVYRLLFLFTAEERGLLHAPDATPEARALYAQGYGLARLRDRARRRRYYDGHADLWTGLTVTFRALARGAAPLGVPALGGLFEEDQCSALDTGALPNARLLSAIHALAFFEDKGSLQRVNYRDMGTEELGSVYESLLELHPVVQVATRPWTFAFAGDEAGGTVKGSERKLSGSYYTPDLLVQELLRLSLDPLVESAIRENPSDPRGAILRLKILDPACGSGHFLLGAARRLADALARLDAESDLPDEAVRRRALREVVRRCIYGVDRNPLAVELCKTALWIEAIEPGRPLSFLEAHIKCGDSLLGVANLSLLQAGVPDDAFVEFDTDNKLYTRELKKRNKEQRDGRRGHDGQLRLPLVAMPPNLAAAVAALTDAPEDTVQQVEAKRRALREVEQGPAGYDLRVACDIWTAAFFLPRSQRPERPGRDIVPTTDALWTYLQAPSAVYGPLLGEVSRVAGQLHFFHWPLEFPEATAQGGFDLILGNPPWETMSPDAKEWFKLYDPAIPELAPEPQAARIAEICESAGVRLAWEAHCDFLYRSANFMRKSGRYRLFAPGSLGKGDFNVWRIFAELALQGVRDAGTASQILPENLYSGANASAIRAELFDAFEFRYLVAFENKRKVWFDIDSSTKFAIYVAIRGGQTSEVAAVFGVNSTQRLAELQRGLPIRIPVSLVREFSPDALAIADIAHPSDIAIVRKIYASLPKFGSVVPEAPAVRYMREVDMGNDNEDFGTDAGGVPLYQGSMVTHFDHRAKAYVSGHGRSVVWEELPFGSASKRIAPQWHLSEADLPAKIGDRWQRARIGFCDVGKPINQRTLMAALIPPGVICGDKVPTITFATDDYRLTLLWLGVANSIALDYVVRKKVSLKVSFNVMDSLPLPRRYTAIPLELAIAQRALRLAATGPEMSGCWRLIAPQVDLDPVVDGPVEQEAEREQLRTELDVLVARDLCGLTADEMRYLLDPSDILGSDCGFETFGALQRAERRQFGDFRTRRLIMDTWERLPFAGARPIESRVPASATFDLLDGAWARPLPADRGDAGAMLAAILKAMSKPLPSRQVRLAAAFGLEPRLIVPYLSAEQRAEWQRLVGAEATPLAGNIAPFAPRVDRSWGDAVRAHRGNGRLVEDLATGTWAPGTDLQAIYTSGWPDGRAGMLMRVLPHVSLDTAISEMPDEIRGWVDAAAA